MNAGEECMSFDHFFSDQSYQDSKALCSHLGGIMSMDPIEPDHVFGNSSVCYLEGDMKYFWIPVIQEGKRSEVGQYSWVDDRSNTNSSETLNLGWHTGQPNGLDFQQCVHKSEKEKWYDVECEKKSCSVCNVPVAQTYRLRGQHLFDQEYILSFDMQQSHISQLVFEGYGPNRIVWDLFSSKTDILDKEEGISRSFNQTPFGLLGSIDKVSNNGYTDELFFTNVIKIGS